MSFAALLQYNPESVNSYVNPNSLLCGDTGQVASGSDEPASLMLVIVRSGSPCRLKSDIADRPRKTVLLVSELLEFLHSQGHKRKGSR